MVRSFNLIQASNLHMTWSLCKGPSLYYVRKYKWVGGLENGNFLSLYVVKMSLRRWMGGSIKPQNTLT